MSKSSQAEFVPPIWSLRPGGIFRALAASIFRGRQTEAPVHVPVQALTAHKACPLSVEVSIPTGQSLILVMKLIGELNRESYATLIDSAVSHYSQGRRYLLLDLQEILAIELTGLFALLNVARLFSGQDMLDVEHGWEALRVPMRTADEQHGACIKLLAPSLQAAAALDRAAFCHFFERYADLESTLATFSCEAGTFRPGLKPQG